MTLLVECCILYVEYLIVFVFYHCVLMYGLVVCFI